MFLSDISNHFPLFCTESNPTILKIFQIMYRIKSNRINRIQNEKPPLTHLQFISGFLSGLVNIHVFVAWSLPSTVQDRIHSQVLPPPGCSSQQSVWRCGIVIPPTFFTCKSIQGRHSTQINFIILLNYNKENPDPSKGWCFCKNLS